MLTVRQHPQAKIITSYGNVLTSICLMLKHSSKSFLCMVENEPNKAHIYFQQEDGSEEVITYGKLWNLRCALPQVYKRWV